MRCLLFAMLSLFGCALSGCGPLATVMPPRYDDEQQKQVDESWNNAFTPADRLDRQSLLDAFFVSQAYQNGVDQLTMRSEKKLNGATAVMEIHFDRAKPDEDRFEVTVNDEQGRQLRHEKYSRADVKRTEEELCPRAPNNGATQEEREAWAKKQALGDKRIEAVKNLLPKAPAEK